MKKNKKIILLFIKVLLMFVIVDSIISLVPGTLAQIIAVSKYNYHVFAEILALLIVLIILKIRKKNYIFNQYGMKKFFSSLYVGLPMLILSIIVLISNLGEVFNKSFNWINFVSIIIYCCAIGFFEECLCRGWLLNEFLREYGNNRKQVITSIILSSLVFGLMHISNIWVAGQSVFETVLQILNAISLGCFLGAIYFRTKNIYAVSFLHGFYDFAIMLSDINSLKDCTTGNASNIVLIYQALATLIIIVIFILCTIIILRKSVLNPLLKEQEELDSKQLNKDDNLRTYLIVAIVILNFLPLPKVDQKDLDSYTVCYDYKEKLIKDFNVSLTTYEDFEFSIFIPEVIATPVIDEPLELEESLDSESLDIKDNLNVLPGEYKFKIYINDERKVVILNVVTEDYIVLGYEDVENLYVINNSDNIIILIQLDENDNSVLYYNKYISKENVSNSIDYLNNISNTFNSVISPDSHMLGSVNIRDDSVTYPLVITDNNDYMILDNNNDLVKIK